MRNILIGVVSSAAMGAALLATTAPAQADDWGPGPYGIAGPGTGKVVADNGYSYGYGYGYAGPRYIYRAPSDGNAGPGPYGIGGPGTGKVVTDNGWGY